MEKLLEHGRFVDKIWCKANCNSKSDTKKIEMLLFLESQQKKTNAIEIEIYNAVAQLPGKYQMIKNLGQHALTVVNHYIKTGRVKIADDHRQARVLICRRCDKHKEVAGSLRCTLKSCGCHLTGDLGRLAFEALPCDEGRHTEIDKKYLTDERITL